MYLHTDYPDVPLAAVQIALSVWHGPGWMHA